MHTFGSPRPRVLHLCLLKAKTNIDLLSYFCESYLIPLPQSLYLTCNSTSKNILPMRRLKMVTTSRKCAIYASWMAATIVLVYFVLIPSWARGNLKYIPGNSNVQIVPAELVDVLKNITLSWKHSKSDERGYDLPKRPEHALPEMLKHLQRYNPSLPTDYQFRPNEFLSKINVDYFMKNTTKDTMGRYIYDRLKNKKNGFFIECGAYDGVYISNTAWLEKTHNWTGLLVEVNPNQASVLQARNRRAWVADVCLSTEIYPITVNFTLVKNGRTFLANEIRKPEPGVNYEVTCYPLHMLLDAIGVSEVDYFSLDVEGVDLMVLKTIPWHRIKIKLISVEILNPAVEGGIQKYLEAVGYKKVEHVVSKYEFLKDDVFELIE